MTRVAPSGVPMRSPGTLGSGAGSGAGAGAAAAGASAGGASDGGGCATTSLAPAGVSGVSVSVSVTGWSSRSSGLCARGKALRSGALRYQLPERPREAVPVQRDERRGRPRVADLPHARAVEHDERAVRAAHDVDDSLRAHRSE